MKELTLEARRENLDQVVDFVNEQLAIYDCTTSTLKQLEMAIEELFVNIAMYAYSPKVGNVTVKCEIQEEPRCVAITFIDEGVHYNPLEEPELDNTIPVRKRQSGGYGIFLAKKSMDDMSYNYEDGKNILTIKKNF